MKHALLVAFGLVLLLSSCHLMGGRTIRGNGNVKTENRTVTDFRSIEVGGNIVVHVKQDSVPSVRVEADEDLMQYIEVYVDDNTLNIRPQEHTNLRSSKGIHVYVSAPSFENFDASGASDIIGESKISSATTIGIEANGASKVDLEIHAPSIDAELSGASTIYLKGETRDFTADGTGASHVKCLDLSTENAEIEMSGASHATVFASVKLKAQASGASTVSYRGNPSVTQESSGAASVRKVE